MANNESCPDCGRRLKFYGTNGSFAIGTMVSTTDILVCKRRHVWLRAHRPEMVGEFVNA